MPKLSRVIKWGLIFIAATAVLLILAKPEPMLVSSNASPNGLFVAENFVISGCDGECSVGRIVVRDVMNRKSLQINLAHPMPAIFFRWADDSHLVVLSNDWSELPPREALNGLSGIQISLKSYPRLSALDASNLAKDSRTFTLNANAVSATYSSEPDPHYLKGAKICAIKIVAKGAPEFKEIGIDITAHTAPCNSPKLQGKNCGAMDSHFWVANSTDKSNHRILTSAYVRGIAGYAVMPIGADHQAIRGQFLGEAGNYLIRVLNSSAFGLGYNFDFINLNLEYEIPLNSISSQMSEFQRCAENTDFGWLR